MSFLTSTINESATESWSKETADESNVGSSASKLRLVVLRTRDELVTSRLKWNGLAGDHPFLCWEWTVAWWQVFGAARQAAVLVAVDDNNRWVGLFPLCLERRRFWGRVLTNMSSGRACADHVRPIIVPGREQAVVDLMADWMRQQADSRAIDLVEWDGVDSGDAIVNRLASAVQADGWSVRMQELESAWITQLPNEWLSFEKSIKKCFRRKIQKAHRNLRLPGVEVRFLEDAQQIQEHWPEIERLHQARRESRSQSGCFAEEGMGTFLQNALMRLADRKKASVVLARQADKPFGMCILLHPSQRWYMYQSGFDPEFSQLEPGHLLLTSAIQQAIGHECRQFDFLRGDEPYKARWNAARAPLARVRLIPNRFLPRIRMQTWELLRKLRNWTQTKKMAEPCDANSPPEND